MKDPSIQADQQWDALRPKERAIGRLAAAGVSDAEIAWRFRCSPGHVERILQLMEVPREPRSGSEPQTRTALERTVVKALDQGASHAEIAARLRRTPGFVARVEQFAALRGEASWA